MAKKAAQALPRDDEGRLIVDGYARMSVGLDGKEENVENQLDDIRAIIERNGWALGELFSDGKSAWKRGVRRPGWDKLIERMRGGLTGGVVVWHQDRLMRQPRDLETLFEIADNRNLELASAHGRRDLRDPDDRFIMRIEVGHACRSSDDTSRRIKRKLNGKRDRGLLVDGGPRAFAWPGKGVDPARLEVEVNALRWAFEHIRDGRKGGLTAVARAWNGQNIRACYGNDWDAVTVRQTMSKQRYAGRIEHDGEVVGTIADHVPTIDPQLFDDVQAIFASRRRGRPPSGKSVASGIVRCGLCGGPISSRPRYRENGTTVPAYRCYRPKGCGKIAIDQEPVNEKLRELTIARLSDPALAARVSALATERDAEIKSVQEKLAAAHETAKNLTLRNAEGDLPDDLYTAGLRTVAARTRKLEEELVALKAAAGDTEAVTAESEVAVAQEWDRAAAEGDIERLRAMLQSALRLVEVVILPGFSASKRRKDGKDMRATIPVSERIELRHLTSA